LRIRRARDRLCRLRELAANGNPFAIAALKKLE
jgi:hypothetical protein